jgi:hypothetical protein
MLRKSLQMWNLLKILNKDKYLDNLNNIDEVYDSQVNVIEEILYYHNKNKNQEKNYNQNSEDSEDENHNKMRRNSQESSTSNFKKDVVQSENDDSNLTCEIQDEAEDESPNLKESKIKTIYD